VNLPPAPQRVVSMKQLLLTPAEVSAATSLGPTTIKALMVSGEIESITIGTARRIPAAALEKWIERKRVAALAPPEE